MLIILVTASIADSWPHPPPLKIALSQSNKFLFAVTLGVRENNNQRCRGYLYAVGKEAELREPDDWIMKNKEMPVHIFVSDKGDVITEGDWGSVGYDNCLVLYRQKRRSRGRIVGEPVTVFKLEDLLTADEISNKVETSTYSRWWTREATLSFTPDSETFVIKTKMGPVLRLDIQNAKVSRDQQRGT